jgi:hypothetical protein
MEETIHRRLSPDHCSRPRPRPAPRLRRALVLRAPRRVSGAAPPESRRLTLHACARRDAQCPGPWPSRMRSCAGTTLILAIIPAASGSDPATDPDVPGAARANVSGTHTARGSVIATRADLPLPRPGDARPNAIGTRAGHGSAHRTRTRRSDHLIAPGRAWRGHDLESVVWKLRGIQDCGRSFYGER